MFEDQEDMPSLNPNVVCSDEVTMYTQSEFEELAFLVERLKCFSPLDASDEEDGEETDILDFI